MVEVEQTSYMEVRGYCIKTKCPRCKKQIKNDDTRERGSVHPPDNEEFVRAGDDMKFTCIKCGLNWSEEVTTVKGGEF